MTGVNTLNKFQRRRTLRTEAMMQRSENSSKELFFFGKVEKMNKNLVVGPAWGGEYAPHMHHLTSFRPLRPLEHKLWAMEVTRRRTAERNVADTASVGRGSKCVTYVFSFEKKTKLNRLRNSKLSRFFEASSAAETAWKSCFDRFWAILTFLTLLSRSDRLSHFDHFKVLTAFGLFKAVWPIHLKLIHTYEYSQLVTLVAVGITFG